jgi:hypothetical protein
MGPGPSLPAREAEITGTQFTQVNPGGDGHMYGTVAFSLVPEGAEGAPLARLRGSVAHGVTDGGGEGSDAVAFTPNRIAGDGQAVLGTPLPVADYRRIVDLFQPLWDLVGPEVTRKVR